MRTKKPFGVNVRQQRKMNFTLVIDKNLPRDIYKVVSDWILLLPIDWLSENLKSMNNTFRLMLEDFIKIYHKNPHHTMIVTVLLVLMVFFIFLFKAKKKDEKVPSQPLVSPPLVSQPLVSPSLVSQPLVSQPETQPEKEDEYVWDGKNIFAEERRLITPEFMAQLRKDIAAREEEAKAAREKLLESIRKVKVPPKIELSFDDTEKLYENERKELFVHLNFAKEYFEKYGEIENKNKIYLIIMSLLHDEYDEEDEDEDEKKDPTYCVNSECEDYHEKKEEKKEEKKIKKSLARSAKKRTIKTKKI